MKLAFELFVVNLSSVPHSKNQHHNSLIFKAANQSIIPYPVSPKPCQILAKRLAKRTWVAIFCNSHAQISQDFLLNFWSQLP